MDTEQAKGIIEALLFTSESPLTIAQIKGVLDEINTESIKNIIDQLKNEYTFSGRSFNIRDIAGGYLITTDPEYAPWLKKLHFKSRDERMSQASLETLSIIAYRQPITRQDIEDIRGVNVGAVLGRLMEKSLIRIDGRKEIVGRPFLYSTTRQFMEFFGLKSLEDLPKLEEFDREDLIAQENGLMPERLESRMNIEIEDDTIGGNEDGEIKEVSQENRRD